MRAASGKGNDARKILSFYKVNFNLSPPYQVLCDGPTIFQSLKNDLYLKQSLPKLLGATAYPVVTNCIVSELKSLGDDFSSATLFAKRTTRIPCAHEEEQISANDCVVACLKQQNEKKFLLATNDVEVLSRLSSVVVGVPLITVINETKLVLKPPSKDIVEYIQEQKAIKSAVTNVKDRALIEKVQAEEMDKLRGRDRIKQIKKRKRAKGPNPLSVKKPKTAKGAKTSSAERSEGVKNQNHSSYRNEKNFDYLGNIDTSEKIESGKGQARSNGVDKSEAPLEGNAKQSMLAPENHEGRVKRIRTRTRKRLRTQAVADTIQTKSISKKGDQNGLVDSKGYDAPLPDRAKGKEDEVCFSGSIEQNGENDVEREVLLKATTKAAKENSSDEFKRQGLANMTPNSQVQVEKLEDFGNDKPPKDSFKESSDKGKEETGKQDSIASVRVRPSTTDYPRLDMQSGEDQEAEEFSIGRENRNLIGTGTSVLKKKQRRNRRRRSKKTKEM